MREGREKSHLLHTMAYFGLLHHAPLKRRLLRLILILSLGAFPATLSAQWVKTNGPYGGKINSISAQGDTVFAATDNGVFCSFDGGKYWTAVDSGLISHRIRSVSILADDVFAGADYTMYRSTDYGRSWYVALSTFDSYIYFLGFTRLGSIDFAYGRGQYEGRPVGGIWRSEDHGANWQKVFRAGDYSSGENIYSMCVYDTLIFAGGNLFYYSTDRGRTWVNPTYAYFGYVAGLAVLPNGDGGNVAIFLGTYYDSLYRSTDLGKSWKKLTADRGSPFVVSGGILYCVTRTGQISWTTDLGESWHQGDTATIAYPFSSLSCGATTHGDTLFYAGTVDGLFRSSDRGQSWQKADSGITGYRLLTVAAQNTLLFAGTDVGPLRSTDRGISWSRPDYSQTSIYHIEEPYNGPSVDVLSIAIKDSIVLLGREGSLLRSTDAGAHWSVNSTIGGVRGLKATDSVWLAATGSSIASSQDDGVSWTALQNLSSGATCMAVDGSHIAVGTGSRLQVSRDGGKSWGEFGEYIFSVVSSVAVQGELVIAGDPYQGVFLSTDLGLTWNQVDVSLPPPRLIGDFHASWTNALAGASGDLFTGSQGGTVYRWVETIGRWHPVGEGLGGYGVNSLSVDGNTLYAGMFNGTIWYRSLSEITPVKETLHELPRDFVLRQNYPNPFNPRTNITYVVGQRNGRATAVKLVIYDLLGKQVAVLVNEAQAPGEYTVQFNGSSLASGVYFCRFQAGGFISIKKLILVR